MRILRTLTERLRREQSGFTLIEVLVVTIIIGILAALALAVLLGERGKAQDANVKAALSSLVTEMESCHVEKGDFRDCDTDGELEGDIGTPMDDTKRDAGNSDCDPPGWSNPPDPGTVGVLASNAECYVVAATSENADGGANHVFISRRGSDGDRERVCGPTAGPDIRGTGTCPSDGTW